MATKREIDDRAFRPERKYQIVGKGFEEAMQVSIPELTTDEIHDTQLLAVEYTEGFPDEAVFDFEDCREMLHLLGLFPTPPKDGDVA